jgi:hypothetical protein
MKGDRYEVVVLVVGGRVDKKRKTAWTKELSHVPAFQNAAGKYEQCGRAGQLSGFGTRFSFFRTEVGGGGEGEEPRCVGRVGETA